MGSAYLEWAKTLPAARYNLATSGVAHYPLSDLGVKLDDLELSGPSWYGYEPLQKMLAAKCGVDPNMVVAATGTSMANHLAMAATIEPGDEVLIEWPAYEPLLRSALYLGAEIKRFERTPDSGFRIDIDRVERAASSRTRLIVITNLHNPSGAFTDEETLARLAEIARRSKARVLVDEVYLEAMFERAPRSAFHLGREFITTGSLTKVYGLSGLRCGWALAEPALAHRMWRLNDLFGVIPAHPAELLSVIALEKLDKIALRAKRIIETNRPLLDRFFDSRDELIIERPEFGTVAFPRLARGTVEGLCALLREKYETTVVPGSFFEMPDHFRIGIGCDTSILASGLKRLGAALDELRV